MLDASDLSGRSDKSRVKTNQNGFSLVELVILVGVVAIVALSVGPLPNITGAGIEAAAKKTASDIRYARTLAITVGTNHGLSFTSGAAYFIYNTSLANVIPDPLTRQTFSEDFSEFENVQCSTTQQVEFDAEGRPVLGGGSIITLTNGSVTRQIQIIANTGLVEIL